MPGRIPNVDLPAVIMLSYMLKVKNVILFNKIRNTDMFHHKEHPVTMSPRYKILLFVNISWQALAVVLQISHMH